MHDDRRGGWHRRVGLVVLWVLLGTLLPAGRAAAHVEVSAEPAMAGAAGAVVNFVAESESTTAGIRALRVQLPDGIVPADVTWASGPPGWSLTATADGYEVSGPPLPAGQDGSYVVLIRQLPDAPTVAFKTLLDYTDGRTDRWIELPDANGAEPENPAPLLTLAPAAPTTSTTVPPASSSSAAAPVPAAATPTSSDGGGLPALVWVGLAVLAATVVMAAVVVVWRRTRDGT